MTAVKKTKPIEALSDLEPMLTRLKLTAIRDQLDSLLDQAGRAELNLREALAMLCAAEVARKDERRIQMGMSIAKFPCVRTLESFEYDAQPSVDPKQIRDLATSRHLALGSQRRQRAVARAARRRQDAPGGGIGPRGHRPWLLDAVRAGDQPGDAAGQGARRRPSGGEADPLHQAQAAGGGRTRLPAVRGECGATCSSSS